MAGQGKDFLSWWRFPRVVVAGLSLARQGSARQGAAFHGSDGQGMAGISFTRKAKQMNVKDYDFSQLRLGDEISRAECEKMIETTEDRNPKQYKLGLLAILTEVRRAMRLKFGRRITVRCLQGGISVLTDSEAAEYNPKRFEQAVAICRRAHRQLCDVDVKKLTDAEKVAFGRAYTSQAARVAMLRVRIDTELPAVERSTPGVVGKR